MTNVSADSDSGGTLMWPWTRAFEGRVILLSWLIFGAGVFGPIIWALAYWVIDKPKFSLHAAIVGTIAVSVTLLAFVWAAASRSILPLAGMMIVLSIALGFFIQREFQETLAGLMWATCTTAVVSFFGALLSQSGPRGGLITKSGMRHAITSAVVLTYLVAVGLVLFYKPAEGQAELPEITSTLIANYTVVVSIVVGFYFAGTSAELIAETTSKATQQQQPDSSG